VYIRPKSRTDRPRKTKIGTGVANVTRDSDTTFTVKRSKVNLQGRGHIVWASRTACLWTKYEADSFIRSIIIRGSQNVEIGSDGLVHDHLDVSLCSLRWKAPTMGAGTGGAGWASANRGKNQGGHGPPWKF